MLLEVIQIIIVTSSFIIILLKFNKQSSDYDLIDESGDTFVGTSRFSTLKRDAFKLVFILLQTGLYTFLFFWDFKNDEESTRLSQDAVFTFCWFYSTIISIIALKTSSRELRWVINIILTIFFTVATMLSLLQMRRIFLIESNDADHTKIQISIAVCNLILSILLTSISITTPRGPKLMHGERPVSGIVYCSIWDFLTFSMISPLINKASKGPLKDSDLEELPFANRALPLYNSIKKWRGRKLLYRIFKANKKIIIIQLILTIISAALYYAPIYLLFQFLELIQKEERSFINIFSVLALMFITNVVLQLIIAQQWFISSSLLQAGIKGQVSSEIYSKSLKRIDLHATSSNEDNTNDKAGETSNNIEEEKDDDDDDDDNEENGTIGKITNLMSVDVGRISEFATWWSSGCIDSPIELVVGLYFLYKLLGVSCLLGLLVLVITLPINHFTAKRYAKTQDNLMKTRDRRINLMNELLQGIRMIKFLGWDKKWEARVLDARGEELVQLKKNFIYLSIFDLLWAASPALVSVISFIAYTKIMGNELTVSIAFTSISLFNELRFAFNVIPEFVMELFQCLISVNRIEKFLEEDEIAISNESYTSIENKIAFENATVTWNKATKETEANENVAPIFTINDLNIEFPMKELSIICGPTGSGKTLLMMSLLGESNIIKGKIFCPRYKMEQTDIGLNSSNWIIENSTAYVAQQAWLQNAAIRDNILFGLPYNESRYKQVIKMCALEKDFRIFEDGDMTEIGEKGITLSGGQKQRCSLARAVYSRAQIIFIDDVLSAVDAHTAKHLMSECILGPLMKGRTRILVTHHVGLCLSGASYLVAINNGKITASSSISNLINTGQLATVLEESDSRAAYDDIIELAAEHFDKENANKDTASSTTTTLINADAGDDNEQSIQHNYKPKVLVEEEKRPTGVVRLKIYKTYFRANGFIIFWLIVALLFIFTRVSQVSESVWLKVWSMSSTDDQKMNVTTILPFISLPDSSLIGEKTLHVYEKHSVEYYCGIYVLITFASILIGFARFCWLYFGSLRASRRLYRILLHQVIRAPLRFFDTTPVGRILNRFSKDFETIDDRLISDLAWFLNNVIMMFSTVIVIVSITKELVIASILFGAYFLYIGNLYTKASRDLKRMDSVIRSPLYTHFTETIIGITTIRAFGVTKQFMEEMLFRIDNNNRPFFYVWLINRWLSIRFNIGGAFFVFLVGLFIIISKVDAGLAGLSLSFAMNFTEQIMWSVRKYTSLEMSLNSVERYHEFTEIPQEAPEIIEPRPPASWPHDGAIDVQNLEVRYAPDLEPVLHHISFYIKGCEKVGLVGRTGSGKSTIALSLFRFIEPSDGRILIDGIDISSIGIEDLRSRITIIPQDPILFSGTIRSNLDAFSDYQDEEIYESLRRVHLLPSSESNQDFTLSGDNINVFKNLDTPISEGGKNLSQGQRQLLCLARALLRRSRIILMDEATASIDFSMDEKIQQMIRTEFLDCTILCIAHRLRTVIDYDKILVIDHGKVIEYDSPSNLILDSNSLFHQMCQSSGEIDLLMTLCLKKGNN